MSELTPLGHKVKKTRKAKPAVWKTARSLKPGHWLCWAMAQKQHAEEFVALVEAWRFHEPVRRVNQAEWDNMAETGTDWNHFVDVYPTPVDINFDWKEGKQTVRQVNYLIKSAKKECIKCGETFGPALDFHHRDRQEKLFNISAYLSCKPRRNLQELYEEIAKCDVLCATCHRKSEHGHTDE